MAKKLLECPCGSGVDYSCCCEPYIKGQKNAPTAETLMRSRYSAYTSNEEAYLLATWHKTTRPTALHFDKTEPTIWLGLTVSVVEAGTAQDCEGSVEFVARYKVNGKAEHLHETSRFVKENERWFYVDGILK